MTALAIRLVDAARRSAVLVIILCIGLSAAGLFHAAGHLSINTDVQRMLPADLPWRQRDADFDRAFPQNKDVLAILVDGRTPESTNTAAAALADRLSQDRELFKTVRRPDGGPFFEKNGILFLPLSEIKATAEQLIGAQPLIGALAQDPSLRGLFDALALFMRAGLQGEMPVEKLDPALAAIGNAVSGVLDGEPQPVSWSTMLGGKTDERGLRQFVLVQPALDFDALEPGARARDAVRRAVRDLKLDATSGVSVRMTGTVALDDEEFATVREGAALSTGLSLVFVLGILLVAMRSVKIVAAILVTLLAGLALTASFASLAVGSLNLISVAFAVLFIGLAADFGIQFCVRYRDQRFRQGEFAPALRGTAETIGSSLFLAAASTAVGFLAFLPTEYAGVSELGLIAGIGMFIGVLLSFTLLPALLTIMRPRGEPEAIGFRFAAPLDGLMLTRRRWIIGFAGLLTVAGIALMPRLDFDFDPIHLKDPRTESVSTLLDMMRDPNTTPYVLEIIAPSLEAANGLAGRLAKLPAVSQAVTASSFIPAEQDEKLAVLSDLALLIGPTLSPTATLPKPTDSQSLAAIRQCREIMEQVAAKAGSRDAALANLIKLLAEIEKRGPAAIEPLRAALITPLPGQLDAIRAILQATPVTLESLPEEMRRSWITPEGRARVEIFPRGDARLNSVLADFVAAVKTLSPDLTGMPVSIQESGRTIVRAFVEAGLIAIVAITILLAIVLRRLRDVALVIAPLLLAAIMTLGITVLIGMPLNYANIIALPLLLGIGVAFDIYFVMNWRAGLSSHLQSSTARAVVFSALTTTTAFGSLMVSSHPGTSDMGKLLAISMGCVLFCTLFILPALLGPAPGREAGAASPPQPARR